MKLLNQIGYILSLLVCSVYIFTTIIQVSILGEEPTFGILETTVLLILVINHGIMVLNRL
jgi:hypothetical protein